MPPPPPTFAPEHKGASNEPPPHIRRHSPPPRILRTRLPGFRGARSPAATESAADTSKFPNLFTHPIGFSIRHPADWQLKNISGTNALIPNDAPIRQGNPAELYALAAMPAPEGADIATELQTEMTKAFPARTHQEFESGGLRAPPFPVRPRIPKTRRSPAAQQQSAASSAKKSSSS